MSMPPRNGPPDVRRALIDSARFDAPSPRSVRKARAAILLAATAAATSTSVATAAATGVVRWAVLVKWLGVGILGGAVTVGAVRLSSRDTLAPASAPQTAPATMSAAPPAKPPTSAAIEPASAPAPSASVAAAPSIPTPSGSIEDLEPVPAISALPAASSSPSLVEEVAVIDEARQALANARGADALRVLDRYQRDYPRGRLGQEAGYLRMQALVLTGNRAAAQQLAEQFLRASPNSPLAPRIRELIR